MTTIIVDRAGDTAEDEAAGTTLREAVILANDTEGLDTIEFDPTVFTGGENSLIRLVQGEIAITESVSIDGSTGTDVTISGDADGNDVVDENFITDVMASLDGEDRLADNSRIFNIDNPTIIYTRGDYSAFPPASGFLNPIALDSLTLTGGRTSGDRESGGAIRAVEMASAYYSFNVGTFLMLESSHFAGNSTSGANALGGAIYVQGTDDVSVQSSTFSGNVTFGKNASGGAFAINPMSPNFLGFYVENSTFVDNEADGADARGGA
ncbi:MAG: hypothetical protein AAFW47_02675, partial [Pseudomonadota bacterium]